MANATLGQSAWYRESVAAVGGNDPMQDAAVFSGLAADPWFTGLDQLPERFTLVAEPEPDSEPETQGEEAFDAGEEPLILSGTLVDVDGTEVQ